MVGLLGVAGSLLGGILGRNSERKAIAAQNDYNDPLNIRARAERAGFNPLLFVGPGVGNQMATGGSNYMGSAIADAGLMLSEPGLFTEACSAFGFLGVRGPGRPLSGALSRIW